MYRWRLCRGKEVYDEPKEKLQKYNVRTVNIFREEDDDDEKKNAWNNIGEPKQQLFSNKYYMF